MGTLGHSSNYLIFKQYCKDELLLKVSDQAIEQATATIATHAYNIKENYRNPAAHKDAVSMQEAIECLKYIVDVEKALRQTLEMFRK